MKNILVIINMQAGSTSDISEEMASVFASNGYNDPTIKLLEAADLDGELEGLTKESTDLLVIYGGDGTCKAGAVAARREGIPIIVLPGGTMNILPNALYDTMDWRIALERALSSKKPRWIPCGMANDEIFFVALLMGDPIIMADLRESVRSGHIIEATLKIPEVMTAISQGENFEYIVDGKPFQSDTNILNVTCPLKPHETAHDDKLEFLAVPNMDMIDILDLGATALIDGWKENAKLQTGFAETLSIKRQGDFDILLDGEPATLSCPIAIWLDLKGVKVLAPPLKASS
ncbi:MAG: diacylglycerol/lipid kinase family protein [Alphaproteobacteria bacterium]